MRAFNTGDVIGSYRLEGQPLGRGGFGSVWRATSIDDGREVALKLLTETYAEGSSGQFRGEIELLAGAAAGRSEHLVEVIDGGTEPVPYIVMEFIRGMDLRAELGQRPSLPQDEVIRIGLGIADALAALHVLGIIHRDVKPANIMLDLRGRIKLTDYGVAKILGLGVSDRTMQNPFSPPYAAPEVWQHRPSTASDLYALGVCHVRGARPRRSPARSLARRPSHGAQNDVQTRFER